MRVAFYENAQDNVPRASDVTWPELVTLLTTHRRSRCASVPCPGRCAAKNGPAWSPVDIADRRLNQNVRAVTVAVFDMDHLTDAQRDAIELEGHAHACHSTHSSKPGDNCLRLGMPLSRPATPAEWPLVREATIRRFNLPADPATKDLSRLYFLPDAPEGADLIAVSADGPALDVDELLASARAGLATRPETARPAPNEVEGEVTDVGELGTLLRRHSKPENRALVSRVLAGKPFGALGEQDSNLQRLMSTVAFCLPSETADDAVIHVLSRSFVATDWQDGYDHLCREALKKLHRARERKASRDAERQARNKAIRERLGLREHGASPAALDEGAEDPDAWAEQLITSATKDGLRVKNCEANIELVLRCAPEWRGALRFNESSKELECVGGPVSGTDPEALGTAAAVWFQRSDYGTLGLSPKPTAVRECLTAVAYANRYDPVRDYLEGLQWDGKGRLDNWLATYFEAEGDAAYLNAIGPKWFISAAARALRPGSKVDTILILEGPQGLKKSTAFEVLGGRWFSDASVDIRNKDSWALAGQFWVLEFAEMNDIRRADIETLKAFVTRREDTYRRPYGRTNVKVPRRCVFVGTHNPIGEYLKFDPSGHRRFWPVKCVRIDLEALRRDRDQLWAEAVVRFHQGEQHWLTDDEAESAKAATIERAENPIEGKQDIVLRWLLAMAPAMRPVEVHVTDVERDAFQLTPDRVTSATDRDAGAVLRSLGFVARTSSEGSVRRRVWVTPETLRAMPQVGHGQKIPHLSLAKPVQ